MIHIKDIAERPSKVDIEALSKFSPATIHEAQGRRGALSSRLKPVDYRMKLCGPAFTVKCAPRDNIMLQLAINYARPGDIIVVSARRIRRGWLSSATCWRMPALQRASAVS